ncbi:CrcB protein [Candidatus Kryptobacter tengchongensis]|nr:CrcB protein [Candidatus Kryptobacter tengchongensis]
MLKFIIAGLGGFVGAGLRYFLSTFTYKILGTDFPYGTFVVNVLGSFLIGLFMGLIDRGLIISSNWRIFIAVGLLGGFTTFSSFSYETVELLKQGSMLTAIANITYTILNCLAATWLGEVI